MRKISLLALALTSFGVPAFPADRHIAFERDNAVYIANLDGPGERKIADGIFPAISPDGTRVAFNTVEKTSDTTYVRRMAVADVATGKVNVFKDVPSENSYYPSWMADGKQILFTTRPHEVWDLAAINLDRTNFRVLKPGVQNEVTCYSPIWGRDGQSVFCQDMTNIYQIGLDGAVHAQWKIEKIIPKGDMSGDGRIDVSQDGKRLLLSTDMGEESGRKDWDGPLPALWAFDLQSQKATRLTPKKLFGWDGVWIDKDNILFLSRAVGEKDDSIYRMSVDGKNLNALSRTRAFHLSAWFSKNETNYFFPLCLRLFFRFSECGGAQNCVRTPRRHLCCRHRWYAPEEDCRRRVA
jgi:TolB protein